MNRQMIQIAYLSFATPTFKMDTDRHISNILNKARDNNARHNITGQLIYRAGIFVQLLEGDKEKVQRLFGAIVLDRANHENIRVLLNQDLKERIFPDWSMAYRNLDNAALDLVNSVLPWRNLTRFSENGDAVPPEKILKIFEELRE